MFALVGRGWAMLVFNVRYEKVIVLRNWGWVWTTYLTNHPLTR